MVQLASIGDLGDDRSRTPRTVNEFKDLTDGGPSSGGVSPSSSSTTTASATCAHYGIPPNED